MTRKINRRSFISSMGAGVAASIAAPALLVGAPEAAEASVAVNQRTLSKRMKRVERVRTRALARTLRKRTPRQRNNSEEKDYPYVASFSKGLINNERGEISTSRYKSLLAAIKSGEADKWELIQLGAKKLKNPLAADALDLTGYDSSQFSIPPAPRIDGAQNSAEMAELYWMALCRDVAFSDYASNGLITDARASLSGFSGYSGPSENGTVTPGTVFRGESAGDLIGPYVSQFLLKDIPFGTLLTTHAQETVQAGSDFLTKYQFWIHRQNGGLDGNVPLLDSTRRYIRNGRDLARYVHIDRGCQPYFNAALIMLRIKGGSEVFLDIPWNSGSPYTRYLNQDGFGTFGYPYLLAIVAEITTRALKAAWFQKWKVHRRLRPETFGGRIHFHKNGEASYPIHQEILASSVLDQILGYNTSLNGGEATYLLPQAYPEGAPLHPAYPSGHATMAGAACTVLKALLDESYAFPNPVVPSADGTSLEAYTGSDAGSMTVGGELNKLAWNVALGRNWAGIHWRTDAEFGLRLGEDVAIEYLRQQNMVYREGAAYQFTKFNGQAITIS